MRVSEQNRNVTGYGKIEVSHWGGGPARLWFAALTKAARGRHPSRKALSPGRDAAKGELPPVFA